MFADLIWAPTPRTGFMESRLFSSTTEFVAVDAEELLLHVDWLDEDDEEET